MVPSSDSEKSRTSPSPQDDIQAVIDGLALLGLKRCSRCGRFYRAGDPGALFDGGEFVCYGCIPVWWSRQSPELPVAEREKLEGKLATWLRKHHQARVVKDPAKLPDPERCEMRIAIRCVECAGTGKLLEGERCRFCNGLGIVFVVVLKHGPDSAEAQSAAL